MSNKYEIFYEATPNPQSMKFNVTVPIANESAFFDNPTQTQRSPLAQKLFGFPWMQAVLIGPDFVTITKQDWVEWNVLADPLSELIAEHLERGEGVLLPEETLNAQPELAKDDGEISENDSPVVRKIKEILNRDIRPAVAMDGGDIVFHKYENHRLYLHMRGACSGCPSASMTLKDGIEARLKEEIPDLVEVVQTDRL